MKSIKKKNDKNNEMVKWAGLIVLLLLLLGAGSAGAYYMLQPDPTNQVLALHEELGSDASKQLSREQRRDQWQNYEKEKEKLTPEQRHKVLVAEQKQEVDRATAYAAMSPDEQEKYLNQRIEDMRARMDAWKKAREAAQANPPPDGTAQPDSGRRGRGGPDGAGGPPGGFGAGRGNEQQRDMFKREMVQAMTPEEKAAVHKMHKDMGAQMKAQGMSFGGGKGGK